MNTVLAAGLSLEGQKYVKKKHCMQGYQFPAVLLQSPSVLSVVQGTLFHPALRGGISLILALVTAPADGFIRSPLGNVIVIVPLAQLGQGKNKCTVA